MSTLIRTQPMGVLIFTSIGPGKTLAHLIKRDCLLLVMPAHYFYAKFSTVILHYCSNYNFFEFSNLK